VPEAEIVDGRGSASGLAAARCGPRSLLGVEPRHFSGDQIN